MNANEARIAKLTVALAGGDIQEVAPNTPPGGIGPPAPNFDLVLEMEAGAGVGQGSNYTLVCTCFDHTDGVHIPALDPGPPLNGAGQFGVAPWNGNAATQEYTFDVTQTINIPGGLSGHVFSYTIALMSANFQQVDAKQSSLFILV